MSYTSTSGQIYSPQPQPPPHYYSATPPAPPPKPSTSSTPARGPPLPPPPPNAHGPSELDGSEAHALPHTHQESSHPTIPPIEPNWLPPALIDKPTPDLHALLQNPTLQTALLDNPSTQHPSIPASQQTLQPVLSANLALSTALSDLDARLTAQRSATQSRLLALRALEQQHRAKLAETEDALAEFSPMALYRRLAASVQEQELLVRGVEESWLDEGGVAGERDVVEFVRRVREVKKTAFLRRERRERWDEGRVGGWR
ncbi:hypothetical protein B0A50_05828 [Salinomyces thailandicus]|uniref:VPS37 C-terminal domain-containing protein n=1 Tax=Salinomyces thailandicus TaxID=706561 RepID=A0A4U0TUT2_9PEZI|nr:hypothetical protein B0A50_05828 [Salinomyces thailandica]